MHHFCPYCTTVLGQDRSPEWVAASTDTPATARKSRIMAPTTIARLISPALESIMPVPYQRNQS